MSNRKEHQQQQQQEEQQQEQQQQQPTTTTTTTTTTSTTEQQQSGSAPDRFSSTRPPKITQRFLQLILIVYKCHSLVIPLYVNIYLVIYISAAWASFSDDRNVTCKAV